MRLRKIVIHILVSAFLAIFCANAHAQESPKPTEQAPPPVQTPPVQAPTTSNGNSSNSPTLTVPPIIRPIDYYVVPPPRPKRRRLTAADSMRIAAQRDSLQRDSIQKALALTVPATTATPNSTTPNRVDSIPLQMALPPEVPILQTSTNPFEILRGATDVQDTATQSAQRINDPLPSALLDKRVYSKNFLFWIFLVTLILMALVVANARAMISNSYTAIINDNALRLINKESFGWSNVIYMALYILFWINGGIFLFLLLSYLGVKPAFNQSLTLLVCIGSVATVFLIKHLILYIVGSVFPIQKEIKTYNFIILTAGILLGLILMPFNIFIAYTSAGLSEIFIYMAFGVIGLVYLVRSLRSLTIASPYLLENKFHFLLYLCAAEIAPLMILIKFIISGIK